MLLIVAILLLLIFAVLGYLKPGLALISSVFVCTGYALLAATMGEGLCVLLAVLIFLVTLVAIRCGLQKGQEERWPHILARSFGILLLLGVTGVLFGFSGVYGAVFFVFLVITLIRFGLTSSKATGAYVMSTIGASMRQNLPLATALEFAAAGRRDKQAKILQGIRKWLLEGYGLSEAIKRGWPKCPAHAVATIAAAERVNQVPLAMEVIEADIVATVEEARKIRPVHPVYPVVMGVFILSVVLMMMTFVLPRFEAILAELCDVSELPPVTRVLMGVSHLVFYQNEWLLGLGFGMLVLVFIPIAIRIKSRPRRTLKPYLTSRTGDFVKWHLPVCRWFERNYGMLRTVELLRLSLKAGCTVNRAIAGTLELDANSRFKKRLRSWLEKVEAGDGIGPAARASGLGEALVWAFSDLSNEHNTLAILETLESFYRSNYSRGVDLARFIFWPCVTIGIGLVVGFVAYAMFSPMIVIIYSLTDYIVP